MPIYEYRCEDCKKKVSILTLRVSEVVDEQCPNCQGRKLRRLLSRFAMPKSEESRLDALADPSNLGGLDENDPKSMAKWMRKMGQEMGEDMDAGEMDQMIDELESGGPEGGSDGDDSDSSSGSHDH